MNASQKKCSFKSDQIGQYVYECKLKQQDVPFNLLNWKQFAKTDITQHWKVHEKINNFIY